LPQCQAVNLPGIKSAHARVAAVPGGQPAGHQIGSRLVVGFLYHFMAQTLKK